ncbi:MAG TPA: DUF1062 domain-containing protein [Amycolatopsis sp.]|nr:DUF1062 domain-containing protein [Amycolatopsis sp.]
MLTNWVIAPTRLPLVRRRCHTCAAGRFRADGKFRVNAHHKLLDVWLLALCTACDETAKLTAWERTNVRAIPPDLLNRLHANDPGLAAELLRDPALQRRNRITLDWSGAWRLDTGGSDHHGCEVLDVSVRFAAPIPIRPVPVIASACGLSRASVDRLLADGKLVSAVRLNGKVSRDFTFTLSR